MPVFVLASYSLVSRQKHPNNSLSAILGLVVILALVYARITPRRQYRPSRVSPASVYTHHKPYKSVFPSSPCFGTAPAAVPLDDCNPRRSHISSVACIPHLVPRLCANAKNFVLYTLVCLCPQNPAAPILTMGRRRKYFTVEAKQAARRSQAESYRQSET